MGRFTIKSKFFSVFRKAFLQKTMAFLGLTVMVLLAFQNCSKGFKTSEAQKDAAAFFSSQCLAKMSANRFNSLTENQSIDCEDARNYSCDVSVFSPNVSNGQEERQLCDSELPIAGCIPLKTYLFNTANAEDNSNVAEVQLFEHGSSYNREEIRCSILDSSGVALKSVDSDSYVQAISSLVKECRQRSGHGAI